MSSDSYEAALSAFIAALRRAWHAAGKPSYHDLEQVSAQILARHRPGKLELVHLARSTIQGILAGHRQQPPRWPWVLTFVLVLHEAAMRAGVDAARIGTVAEWKRRHEALCAAGQVAQLAGVGAGHSDAGHSDAGHPDAGHSDAGHPDAGHSDVGHPGVFRGTRPNLTAPAGRLDDAGRDARFGEILSLVRQAEAGEPQWWHQYRDVAPGRLGFYLYLESIAKVIRMYKTQALPGLLQAEAYAYALLRRVRPDAPAREITRTVELRMRRQQILDGQGSCHLWAIVAETAVRNRYLGSTVMRAQIRHLIEVAERPNITVQVLRDDSGDSDMIREPLTVFRFAEPYMADVAFLGPRRPGGLVLHERTDVEHYSQLLSYLGTRARAVRETPDLLRRILAET
jgi:hypothetical protein